MFLLPSFRRGNRTVVYFLSITFVGFVLLLPLSHAQDITTSIKLDGTLGTTVYSNSNVFNIEGGKILGANQFHSFEQFNVGTGDIASFNGPRGIENILSRVTGGSASNIDGTLRSTIDGANLFFMNPAGVMFGPSASLELSGSFHVSTADYIRLGDEPGAGIFSAVNPANDILTSASPEAFGFLGDSPSRTTMNGGIQMEGTHLGDSDTGPESQLVVSGLGNTFSIIGRDARVGEQLVPGVEVKGTLLEASNGRVNLVSVGSKQTTEVGLNEGLEISGQPSPNGFLKLSDSTIVNSGIPLKPNLLDPPDPSNPRTHEPIGPIVIRGGQLVMEDSLLTAITSNGEGASIDIQTRESITISGTNDFFDGLSTSVFSQTLGSGNAGEVILNSKNVSLHAAVLSSSTFGGDNAGNAGNISLVGEKTVTMNGGQLFSATLGNGNSGNLTLIGETVKLNAAFLSSGTSADLNAGDAGNVIVKGKIVTLNSSFLSTETLGPADAGGVSVMGESVSVESATLTSNTSGMGNAGSVSVSGETVTRIKNTFLRSNADRGSTGNAGSVSVTGEAVSLENATLTSDTFGAGDAGNIIFKVGTLDVASGTVNSSSIEEAMGKAGSITIQGMGGAGTQATNVTLVGTEVTTAAETTGAGGSIIIGSNNVRLLNTSISATVNDIPEGTDPTGVADISLNVSSLSITGSNLDTKTGGSRQGGNITVNSEQQVILIQTEVSAKSTGLGDAGGINLETGKSIFLKESVLETVASQADGGDIKLTATDTIQLTDSLISSSVGGGVGGNINLDPDFIILNHSDIFAQAGEGQGGQIQLTANVVLADPFSNISASAGPAGIDGSVSIQAPIQNLSGTVAPLPEDVIKVAQFYASRCAAQKGGKLSSFVYHKVPVLPIQPGDFMNSHVAWTEPNVDLKFADQDLISAGGSTPKQVSRLFDLQSNKIFTRGLPSIIQSC